MERIFDEQLMKKAKRIFEERSGLKMTDDEVEIHLERLSRLGLLFAKVMIQNEEKEKNNAIDRKKIQ
ncbi:MAG: hypothetical protein PHF35_04290 [Candidatus Moranbacteria bacterium]|nr:hypothetical protein [Candidatus Moranbacteria bacterium]